MKDLSTMEQQLFSIGEMEERLIATMMTYPELYNPSCRDHKDTNRRGVVWSCVVIQVGISGW